MQVQAGKQLLCFRGKSSHFRPVDAKEKILNNAITSFYCRNM